MGVVKNQRIRSRKREVSDEFEISGVYLLNTEGIILSHKDIDSQPDFDVDIFGSMFTAIKIFIEDSLQSDNQLECINYGGFKILIENSKEFFVVLIGTGMISDSVKGNMKWLVERIKQDYGDAISHWKGDVSEMMAIDRVLDDFTKSFRLH
jgi:hypothetical protein